MHDLKKLRHVPVYALRNLIEDHAPGETNNQRGWAELLARAEEMPTLTAAEVERLYENYRYGANLSFYVYLLPEGLPALDRTQLQRALDELSTQSEPPHLRGQRVTEDYELEEPTSQILLLDEEQFDGICEMRFRYYALHRFLNADEQPDQILQTRYGFLWLDLKIGYLAILTRDEWLIGLWTRVLSNCLRAIPRPVRFPKEIVDKHFSIEKVKRVSHYDPSTGIHQSVSGQALWKKVEQEILNRDRRYVRPSSLYEEEIAEGVTSVLGVTANKGKIYLTRTLPTSLVRAWGRQRLPELMRDLHDLYASQPEAFPRPIEAINRMRLPAAAKVVLVEIVEALLQADCEASASADLPSNALEIYEALAGKYFAPYLRAPCSQCDESAELCPRCGGPTLQFTNLRVQCKACRATVSEGESVALGCMNGHTTRALLPDVFCIAPNHWLQKKLTQILSELDHRWEENSDYFCVEQSTLYRLRRGQANVGQLPAIVQNYVNNFWDLAAGQVHAGSGDLVVAGQLGGQSPDAQFGSGHVPGGVLRTYRNFDLRLRANGAPGYTVEAAVEGGGSIPPQPLDLPSDGEWQRRLDSLLRQSTDSSTMRQVGEALHSALFPSRIARLWAGAVGGLPEDVGLRIRLHVDRPELMALPWELIFDDGYVGLHLRFPIVRCLDLPTPPRSLAVGPPLRVLLAAAQPRDAQPVGVAAEVAAIRAALRQLPDKVEMGILAPARRDELLARLRRGYHVVHYIGHGAFHNGEGYLILEDSQRKADPVSASLVGQLVTGSSLRLAVLNACETSATGPGSPSGGLAHQMAKAGMPAVVAMQMAIAEPTASAFAREFYGALADGWPVEAAVQEGRRGIVATLGNSWDERVDWAIPTLYLRAPNGLILKD
jgi:hypothetical protein